MKILKFMKSIDNLNNVSFSSFGVKFKDGIDCNELYKHIKSYDNERFLEEDLNKFVNYLYNGEISIHYHRFRNFPYIQHHYTDESQDCMGHATNYTIYDIYLVKFIRKFLIYKNKKFYFFDADYFISIIENTDYCETSMLAMPIDEILKNSLILRINFFIQFDRR